MSYPYQDPYYSQQHRNYNPQQPYTDEFNPYSTHQPHPTYDQSGYQDDDAYRNVGPGDQSGFGHSREKSQFDDAFPGGTAAPAARGSLRVWRKDHRGPLWAAGGRGKCVFRFCCCSILIFLFLVVSIVLTLGIWIRPPDITINQVGLNSTGGSAVSVSSSTLGINFAVNISVENPNYFAIAFKRIRADLSYPTNDMDLGGGEKDDITFHSHTQTTFNFPFTLEYNLTEDSNQTVLKDLLSKCGITGTQQDVDIDYKITLGLRILFVTVSPSFSNSFSFTCPKDEIESFLQSSGLSGLTSALGGGSG